MVKEPVAGRVKTRLARDIGTIAATCFYRHVATAVIRRLAVDQRWQTWLAVSPDTASTSRFWPHHLQRKKQGSGNLGERMQAIMHWRGTGPTVIVGTDIPAIQPWHIASAFRTLTATDAVLGPTPDGGYWLVGLRRSPRILQPFHRVRWSSEHALSDTLANLPAGGTGLLACLDDVDRRADWLSTHSWSGRIVLPLATRQDHNDISARKFNRK
jgi:uncharacterized protein